MSMSQLDPAQIVKTAFDDATGAISTKIIAGSGSLISVPYDYFAITYITVGNGIGNPGTIVYKMGGPSGVVVGTVSITYDSSSNPISVYKT